MIHKCIDGIVLCIAFLHLVRANDRFAEELFLKPFPSGHVYSFFQFTTVWDVDIEDDPYRHCHLFPRGLGEIVARYNVEELHISLTQGIWRHENWGYPVYDAPPGAEIWAWFRNGTKNVDETWKQLTATLSGLLCASLNFIETSNTMSPEYSFRPMGIVKDTLDSSRLRYATLPQEIVCTENLTPWKKLLPCDSRKGLATLLNAGAIHDTNYHSVGIHLRNICRNLLCVETSIELKQTVSLVHDLVIFDPQSNNFSFRKLFGSGLSGPCPLAETSQIYVDVTLNQTDGVFQLMPPPTKQITSTRGGYTTELAVYDVKSLSISHMFNVAAVYREAKVFNVKQPPVLSLSRYIVGYGQEKGGIVTRLHNRYRQPLDVVLLENIPWFVPVYLHTLKIKCNDFEVKPAAVKYIPGNQRQNPYYLEILVRLPARAITEISIELDYVFLKWQEYPPDANHGFYIGSAVVTTLLPIAKNYTGIPQDVSYIYSSFNASREGYFLQLRTESMIIVLPTPDFSMPYNVICLACTVVALAFGPIHNITTKRLRAKELTKRKSLLPLLIGKITNIFVKNKVKEEDNVTNTEQE